MHENHKWRKNVSFDLCPFDLIHVIYTWNDYPRKDINWKTQSINFVTVTLPPQGISKILQTYFPFDCPVYVFHENLQDDKKLPKCDY